MADEKIAETDEEIIDLTELIEKGEATEDAPPPEKAGEEISAHMQSLRDDPAQRDDMKNDAPSRQDDTEIDALLAQMEAHADSPEEQLSPEQAAAPGHKVDPNEKLDMSGMGDVDKLLNTLDIPPQPRELNAEAGQQADTMELDNAVDDLLNSMNGAAPKAETETAPDAPDAPDEHDPQAAAPQPAEQDITADLDALLASEQAAPAATPTPEPESQAPAPAAPDLTDDLDTLLGDLDLTPPAAPQQAAPAVAPKAKAASQAAPKAEPQAQAAPEADAPDAAMDLDALLAAIAPDTDMPEAPAPQTPLDAVGPDAGEELPAEPAASPVEAVDAPDVPAAENESAQEQASASALESDPDALLQSPLQEEPAPDATPHAEPDMAQDMMADMANQGTTDMRGEADALEGDGLALPEESPEAAGLAMSPTAEAELPAPPAEELSPLPDAEAGAPLSSQADAPAAETPTAPPVEPAQLAAATVATRLPEQGEESARLSERLQRCESELAEAKARISALEKAVATPAASLEDLLRTGTPLHDSFAALIASSVSQALKEAPALQGEALEERLHHLSIMGKSVSARMDALESRLDTLEPRFNQQVEKAAAGAAARILREEIARLIQG